MDWTRAVDGYCERTGAGLWAEPVNAVTNLAFLVARACLARTRGQPLARALAAVLALIGIGSFLFHTAAQVWAAIVGQLPILVFHLIYIFAANRDFWGLGRWFAHPAHRALGPA